MEQKHILFWEKYPKNSGYEMSERKPSMRSRVLIWLASKFGTQIVLGAISQFKRTDQNIYRTQPETATTKMTSEEKWHTAVLREIEKNLYWQHNRKCRTRRK